MWNLRGQSSNCAKDIAAGPNGSAWEIGCNSMSGGFNIAIYHPNTQTWTSQGSTPNDPSGVRIAVEIGGAAWLVNSEDEIYRTTSEDPDAWEIVDGRATDIGAGPTLFAGRGYAFVTGTTTGDVYVWNEQNAIAGDDDGPGAEAFQFFSGQGTRIAVGTDGKPWVGRTLAPPTATQR